MNAIAPPVSASKLKKKKSKATPSNTTKKSRGWGPFQSVLKERSVDFNLTLDVQNLQQQVRDLATLRDVLSTRTMLRRHSPGGSLFHVVKEYFHVFRTGWAVQEGAVGCKRLLGEQDQRQFLHSVMDPEVDVDNGLRGPDVMAKQILMYSTFIKFIRTTLQSYDIVVADDSVIIKTQATLRFQVLRNTIEMIFPHIIGDECLVAQLVGQVVEPPIGITFYFNSEGNCCKYEVELDFVEAFASIVKDPRKLEMMLGRALIAENCMFGVIDEPIQKNVEVEIPNVQSVYADVLEYERDRLVEELKGLRQLSNSSDEVLLDSASVYPPSKRHRPHNSDASFLEIVNAYYRVFEYGYRRHKSVNGHPQGDFVSQVFAPGSDYVLERWQALSASFDVVSFRQHSTGAVEYYKQENACEICSTANYMLRITPYTLETVFPHVLEYRSLAATLLGSSIEVPSQLVFSIEMDTGRVLGIVERMDFATAVAALLQDRKELSFVMSRAALSLDGISHNNAHEVPATLPPLACQGPVREGFNASPVYVPQERVVKPRMSMADILLA